MFRKVLFIDAQRQKQLNSTPTVSIAVRQVLFMKGTPIEGWHLRSMPLNSKGNKRNELFVYLLGVSQEHSDKQNTIYHMMLVIKIP